MAHAWNEKQSGSGDCLAGGSAAGGRNQTVRGAVDDDSGGSHPAQLLAAAWAARGREQLSGHAVGVRAAVESAAQQVGEPEALWAS